MKTVSTKLLESFIRKAVRAKLQELRLVLSEGTNAMYVGDSGNMKVGSGQGGPESPRGSGVQLSGKPMMDEQTPLYAVNEDEAEELHMYITTTSELEYRRAIPIRKTLMRKMTKGVYNPDLAIKLWMYLVDDGAKMYKQEYGDDSPLFTKPTRLAVASQLAKEFEQQVKNGEYTVSNVLGRR